jgi:hypothetical protein
MANDIQVQKTVFSNTEFGRVVGTTFNTFTQPDLGGDLDPTVEFFKLYEDLYYVIDVTGETDSHEYLVRRSSELLNFDTVTEDIQPLLDEIAELRQENLALNQQILDLETKV